MDEPDESAQTSRFRGRDSGAKRSRAAQASAIHEGVVGDLAGAVHALRKTQLGKALLEGARGVLTAAIGVKHRSGAAPWGLRTALLVR